jgi:peptide/nickel transport system substrate-binding protein
MRPIHALLALALAAALVPARPAAAYEPHVLRFVDTLDINTLNPWIGTSSNIVALSELTAAFFTRLDDRGDAVPELATVVPSKGNGGISADGKTITWHLRHGVKWSDGVPLDSADVLYSIDVAKNPQNNISVHDMWDRLQSASAPDKYTVIFRLKEPYATFVDDYFNSESNSAILPKHIVGPGTLINDSPYNALPVGCGPFRYTAFRRGDAVEMEANPNYWRGLPKLHKIVYKLISDENTDMTQLTTGEVDLWDTINGSKVATAKALPGKAWISRLSQFMSGVYFNTSQPQIADPAVRRALRAATNRELIFNKVNLRNGTMTESVVPQFSHGYVQLPLSAYDPAGAERMLDAAGWKRGADGVRRKNGLTLSLDIAVPSGYLPSAVLATILQNDYTKIGVATTIHSYDSGKFFAPSSEGGILQAGKFDVALFSSSLGPAFANINGVYTCDSFPPAGLNQSRYCNRKVDALNDRYLHSYDPAVQNAAAAEYQRLIDAEVPVVMIYERAFVAVYDKRLTGYRPTSFAWFGSRPWDIDI